MLYINVRCGLRMHKLNVLKKFFWGIKFRKPNLVGWLCWAPQWSSVDVKPTLSYHGLEIILTPDIHWSPGQIVLCCASCTCCGNVSDIPEVIEMNMILYHYLFASNKSNLCLRSFRCHQIAMSFDMRQSFTIWRNAFACAVLLQTWEARNTVFDRLVENWFMLRTVSWC